MSDGILPPRKRDWKRGTPQVGVFIRTADGDQIHWVHDRADGDELAFAMLLARGLHRVPEKLRRAVREEFEQVTKLRTNGKHDS